MLRLNRREKIRAFLGEGTAFKGLLNFEGTVRIDGRLEGEIDAKGDLVLGETAVIEADISVNSLITKGKVFGNIVASEKVEIHSQAEVFGNIKTSILRIEEGATFVGKCDMAQEGEKIIGSPSAIPSEKEDEARQLVLYSSKKK
jgi:cytoskeletal protein CcmA (bactofilin family)